jgi:acetylornithine deacetylase/succinyl-diaminopimelate desuccinylase-like protein
LKLNPGGCFAAAADQRLVGTATTTTYGRGLAWVGMVLVDPEFRLRGIATRLVRAALGHLDEAAMATVTLDATPNAEVALAVGEVHRAEFGGPCEGGGAHYGTDASKLARAGIETVVCGPGDVAQAHTKEEYVEVEQLGMTARLYGRILDR